ncbi:unnamed protein product [Protopolystoma xenopodis]|uniref:Uncharacterized protein n=1 Tax=Protopolystoma xenopodis TaxID=117903 RepID=A0A448XDD3_9PLAT|nr:unnamed protein product [Protopolystoma xenopodis]
MICLASETEGDTTESDCGTANCRAVLREEGSGQIIGMTIMAPPPSPALTSTLRLLRDLPTKGGISTSAVESELQSLPGRLSSLPSSSDCEKESAGHEIHSLPNAVSTPVNCSRQMISSVVACGLNVTQDSADEPRNGMVGLTTYDAENKPNAPSSVGVMDEEEGEDEVRGNSTTSTSLDEALSAAMEAIAQVPYTLYSVISSTTYMSPLA